MNSELLFNTLTFEQSNIWDSALHIADVLQKSKTEVALDANLTPDQRSYACGQAAALTELIYLLKETHEEVRARSNMKSN